MSRLTDDEVVQLERYAAALEDGAKAAEVAAAAFREEFDACWSRGSDGHIRELVCPERALQIKDLVLDGPRMAKRDREVAALIRRLVGWATDVQLQSM